MSAGWPDVETLLPQSGPMRLVGEVVGHSPEWTECAVDPARSGLFVDDPSAGTVPPWVALEWMAQVAAVHGGLVLAAEGGAPSPALLIGSRRLRFAVDGACVMTPSGAPPPPAARLSFHHVREQNGWILAWFHPAGEAPDWEVPPLDDRAWNRPRVRHYTIATTPQETTENSVDFAHFTQLHGFVDGSITRPIEIEGELLQPAYCAHRPLGLPGLPKYRLPVFYHVNVWGLGYSQVDVTIPRLRFDIRIWVLPIPVDAEHIELRLAASTKDAIPLLGRLARRIAHHIKGRKGTRMPVSRYTKEPPATSEGNHAG